MVAVCTIQSNVASCMGCFGTRFVVIPGKTRISFDGGKLTPGDLNSLFCVTLRVFLLDGVNINVCTFLHDSIICFFRFSFCVSNFITLSTVPGRFAPNPVRLESRSPPESFRPYSHSPRVVSPLFPFAPIY